MIWKPKRREKERDKDGIRHRKNKKVKKSKYFLRFKGPFHIKEALHPEPSNLVMAISACVALALGSTIHVRQAEILKRKIGG